MEALFGRKRKGKKGYLFIDTTIPLLQPPLYVCSATTTTTAPFVYHVTKLLLYKLNSFPFTRKTTHMYSNAHDFAILL